MASKKYGFRAPEDLHSEFKKVVEGELGKGRPEVLREYMRATIAQEAIITEVDASASSDSDSGVTNEDLLVAIQNQSDISNRIQGGDSDDESLYSVEDEGVTGEMAVILYEYNPDADVLSDAVTPDGRDDVLSREILKRWAEWNDVKELWVPELNPDHVHEDHRPQGMSQAVALTWGVLRYESHSWVKASRMVDVMDEELGWTRSYMLNEGFKSEIKSCAVSDPLDDSKYITDNRALDKRMRVVGAKASSALERITTAESFSTISSAQSDAFRFGSILDSRGYMEMIGGGQWDQMADDFSNHVDAIVKQQKRVVANQAVTEAETLVADIGEMMRDESGFDVSDILSNLSQITSEKQSVQDMQSETTNSVDFSDTLSDLDAVLSDAAVAVARGLTIEIRSMTDEIDESDDVVEIESALEEIEDIADDAVETVEEHATEEHCNVVDSVEEALAAAEDRHDEAREVALEREVAAAEEVESKWGKRALHLFELCGSPDSPIKPRGMHRVFKEYDEIMDEFPSRVTDEMEYVLDPDVDWVQKRNDLISGKSCTT